MIERPKDRAWMVEALSVARRCAATGDVPVGAVVVGTDGSLLGVGWNEREASGDPTAHAEICALRAAAGGADGWRLTGATLVVTLEPCPMCAGAAILARIDRLVFGAWDPKAGACGSVWDLPRDRRSPHRIEVVGGVNQRDCADLLEGFFGALRGHR